MIKHITLALRLTLFFILIAGVWFTMTIAALGFSRGDPLFSCVQIFCGFLISLTLVVLRDTVSDGTWCMSIVNFIWPYHLVMLAIYIVGINGLFSGTFGVMIASICLIQVVIGITIFRQVNGH